MVVVVVGGVVVVVVYEILRHLQPSPSRNPRSMYELCFRYVLDYVEKYVSNVFLVRHSQNLLCKLRFCHGSKMDQV